MAYAALVSLKQTIERLVNSSRNSILPPCPEVTELVDEIRSLQEFLNGFEKSSGEREDVFDGKIRKAASTLEDWFLSQSSSESCSLILEIKQQMNTFTRKVKEVKKAFREEVLNRLPEEDVPLSSRIGFHGKKRKVVGLSDDLDEMNDMLSEKQSSKLKTLSIYGMAGSGKTTLAYEIFDDPLNLSRFDCCAWVNVNPKCRLREIMLCIVAQMDLRIDMMMLMEEDDEELIKYYLFRSLKGRRYLIVLDDIWDKHVRDELRSLLPDGNNGSRVLLTTRLFDVALAESISEMHFMSDLDKESSWYLFHDIVFAQDQPCPPQLEKAGKKIVEKCEDHPLTIVTIAEILSKAEKTPEYWNEVAEGKHSVFKDAYNEMSMVLLPSYEYLPQYLKACFLYMGVFPQNYKIPSAKLSLLWIAEGFLEQGSETSEGFCLQCLTELDHRNLARYEYANRFASNNCSIHTVYWHLCIREAEKNKFLHVLNNYANSLAEGMKSQRRLCIHNNVLLGIKDVYNSLVSISTVHSLLCTGKYHQYPVPLCLGLRLLRVLNALTIRLYEFPIEVLKLIHLRYLSLTFNGELPSSISNLWNLECLIVGRHMSIKSSGAPSYMPVEIWDMQELKHLQVMGSNLPDAPCEESLLPNLLTLLDVSAHTCTKCVLKRLPNLKKLGIQIELLPGSPESLSCFDHISHLHRLESLKCVIVNPRFEVFARPVPLSNFSSSSLKKLSLSGFGYQWEDMRVIASLPKLAVLKLRSYAFRGPKWETIGKGFLRLEILLIEDTDLMHWTAGEDSFPQLEYLTIKHCHKLEQIPKEVSSYLIKMELVDCNPLAVASAKQNRDQQEVEERFHLYVHCSGDDGNLKS